MAIGKKRVYRSETRDARARETRLAILEAAKGLFQVEGFECVTIKEIAEASEVSVPTVYALFKSKRGVLQALIDEALPSEQFAVLVDHSMQETSGERCLGVTAKLARQLYDAERELMSILRGISGVAPEFREFEEDRERRRYERQGDYVKKLMKEGWLAKDLSLERARDILWTLTGRDLYRMLVTERGWSSDAYEKWLRELLIQSLLKQERG